MGGDIVPTERFYNLPEEKRRRITEAIYSELCRVPFDEISINKIIKTADIPRGSFYQYFDDKSELVSYIMEEFQNILFNTVKNTLIEAKGDVFDTFEQVLVQIIEFGKNEYSCILLKNVFHGLKVTDVKKMNIFKDKSNDLINELFDYMDVKKFKSQKHEDIEDAAAILAFIMWSAVTEAFIDISHKDEIIERAKNKANLIKVGIYKEDI